MFRSFILSNIEQYHFLRLQIGGVAELGLIASVNCEPFTFLAGVDGRRAEPEASVLLRSVHSLPPTLKTGSVGVG
jgi:hypothetical protein